MKRIKCVVWDLDNTIWKGVLSENDEVILIPGVEDVIKELDKRGILQSISSKNEYDIAKKKLDLVIDGRMARTGANTNGLDITDEVVKALNKKITSVKMSTPKGL